MRKLTSFSIARDSGFTVMDMLTTLGILSVLALIPLSNIRELESPIDDASFQLGHYLRLEYASYLGSIHAASSSHD